MIALHLRFVMFVVILFFLLPLKVFGEQVNILVVAIHGVKTAEMEWQPTIDFLSESLPHHSFKLVPVIPAELQKIRSLIRKNEIDFIISQPAIYVDLELKFGISRILTMVKGDGYSQFGSVIIVRSDSDIYSIDDLHNKSIAGVSPLGFGGWLLGYREMLDNGFDPFKSASRVDFLGTQPKQIEALLTRQVDAAVIRTGVLEKMSSSAKINLQDIRVLAARSHPGFNLMISTALYPEWAFAKTHKASNSLSTEVALALLSLKSSSMAAQQAGFNQWTFPYDYQPVHKLLKSLKVGPYKNYGKVSLPTVIIDHWPGVLAFIFLTLTFFSIILIWNRKLKREIQVRKNAEKILQENEKNLLLAASVFSHTDEGIAITDPDANIMDVNESFCRITGYSREEVLGKKPNMFKSGRQDKKFYQVMWQQLIEQGHWVGEIWNRHKDNSLYAEKLNISAVKNGLGQTLHYVAIFSDITHQVSHQEHMKQLAYYDALTSLPNRVLLADRLQQAMSQAKRRDKQLAVVYLDLDGFKEVNDSYGHETGDQLLSTISGRMLEVIRKCDTIARLGGDEFVVLLNDISSDSDFIPLLERLLLAASKSVTIGSTEMQISASLGVAVYPDANIKDADQLLQRADLAMYQAKQSGKNRYKICDNPGFRG